MTQRLLEIPLKLIASLAAGLTVMIAMIGMVTWLAAKDSIVLAAHIFVWLLVSIITVLTLASVGVGLQWIWHRYRLVTLDTRQRTAEIERLERDASIMTIAHDGGTFFAFKDATGSYAVHAAHLQHNQLTRLLLPSNEPPDEQVDLMKWALFTGRKQKVVNELMDGLGPQAACDPIPDRVELQQVLNGRPSLNRLVLGVGENNQIVTESLRNLTHIAIGGVTRFGKSIFCQALLYQIATSKEEVTLYLADLGGTTFIDFGLPYASTLAETETMVKCVMSEAERRKGLYEATGRGIRSLDIYNQVTGDNLPWIVMIVDEALYLMEKSKTIKGHLEIAVSWAAKYGISCIIVSQDWKSNVIDTSTRNNFSSRFQFMAEDRTQADILIKGSLAHEIENKGRCFARLPGQNKITELQTPFISEDQVMAIAPHIQYKAGVVETSQTETAAPQSLSFVVAPAPAPDRPTEDEMIIIEAVKAVEAERGRIVWSDVTSRLGWTATGPNNQRIKSVLDKWEISY